MSTTSTSSLSAQKYSLSSHARVAFGMRAWIADAYADIATASPAKEHSATATLRACSRLTSDDSGSVDPLTSVLAQEVLRLNSSDVALAPNDEATMHTVLDLLGLQYAEPEEKTRLLSALGSYLKSHEFADDGNFRKFASVVDAASSTPGL